MHVLYVCFLYTNDSLRVDAARSQTLLDEAVLLKTDLKILHFQNQTSSSTPRTFYKLTAHQKWRILQNDWIKIMLDFVLKLPWFYKTVHGVSFIKQ